MGLGRAIGEDFGVLLEPVAGIFAYHRLSTRRTSAFTGDNSNASTTALNDLRDKMRKSLRGGSAIMAMQVDDVVNSQISPF